MAHFYLTYNLYKTLKGSTLSSKPSDFRLKATITIITNPRHQAILNVEGFGPCFIPRCATSCLSPILSNNRIDFVTCHGDNQADGLYHYSAYILDNLDQVYFYIKYKKNPIFFQNFNFIFRISMSPIRWPLDLVKSVPLQ